MPAPTPSTLLADATPDIWRMLIIALLSNKNPDGTAYVLPVSTTLVTNQTGTWTYYAGASGTVNVGAGQRVIGIAAHATTAGSMTINAGASVPIPANVGIQFTPQGNLVAPTLVFTGTDSYVVETVS